MMTFLEFVPDYSDYSDGYAERGGHVWSVHALPANDFSEPAPRKKSKTTRPTRKKNPAGAARRLPKKK